MQFDLERFRSPEVDRQIESVMGGIPVDQVLVDLGQVELAISMLLDTSDVDRNFRVKLNAYEVMGVISALDLGCSIVEPMSLECLVEYLRSKKPTGDYLELVEVASDPRVKTFFKVKDTLGEFLSAGMYKDPCYGPDSEQSMTLFGRLLQSALKGQILIDLACGDRSNTHVARAANAVGIANYVGVDLVNSQDFDNSAVSRKDYRMGGEILDFVSRCPDNVGCFHISGFESRSRSDRGFVLEYLDVLVGEVFRATKPGGVFLVGKQHCSVGLADISKYGFRELTAGVGAHGSYYYRVFWKPF